MDESLSIAVIGEKCTGCKLCAAICPRGAIAFDRDEEGFWQPAVDTAACDGCGLCRRKCPALHRDEVSARPPQTVYGGWSLNEEIHRTSSSGGVFTHLALETLRRGGAVYGAVFDEHWGVRHARAAAPAGLVPMRGSKYLQSDCDIYAELAQDLEEREVLFCGTPCQIAAVRAFAGAAKNARNYSNLICIDFLCNSVISPLLFQSYCRRQERKAGAKIAAVNFRDPGARKPALKNYGLKFQFDDGSSAKKDFYADPYNAAFILRHCLIRKACFECPFAGANRYSDITLADFWGVPPAHFHLEGVSLMLINTEKGRERLDAIRRELLLFPSDLATAAKSNRVLRGTLGPMRPAQRKDRERALQLIREDRLEELFDVYLGANPHERFLFFAKYLLDRAAYLRLRVTARK